MPEDAKIKLVSHRLLHSQTIEVFTPSRYLDQDLDVEWVHESENPRDSLPSRWFSTGEVETVSRAFGLPESFYSPQFFEQDAPGIDVLGDVEQSDVVFTVATRRLVGALHRRLWRRCTQLRLSNRSPLHSIPDGDTCVVDLALDLQPEMTWLERYDAYVQIAGQRELATTVGLHVRGWDSTEYNVLVDGVAVPGCVVDVAVAMSAFVEDLRAGHPRLVIAHDAPTEIDAELWTELLDLAHDRLGVARGTVARVEGLGASKIAAVA